MTTFKYFGYASNLAEYKVGLRCKSCQFYGLARLLDHSLDFGEYSPAWCGGSATVRKEIGTEVWGAVWIINISEQEILDHQEGVSSGHYRASTIKVVDSNNKVLECRAYEQIGKKSERCKPSPQYLAVILDGARRRGLPKEYISKLAKVETNRNDKITDLMIELRERRKELGLLTQIF